MKNYKIIMPKISIRDISSNPIARGRKGWITPDGDTIPLDDEFQLHGQWVLKHYDSLKSMHRDLPSFREISLFKSGDDVRDMLVSKGWVHIYSSSEMTVYKLNEKTRRNILDAILMRTFSPNYPLRIYESSSDYVFTLREENIEDKDIYAFEID